MVIFTSILLSALFIEQFFEPSFTQLELLVLLSLMGAQICGRRAATFHLAATVI